MILLVEADLEKHTNLVFVSHVGAGDTEGEHCVDPRLGGLYLSDRRLGATGF